MGRSLGKRCPPITGCGERMVIIKRKPTVRECRNPVCPAVIKAFAARRKAKEEAAGAVS